MMLAFWVLFIGALVLFLLGWFGAVLFAIWISDRWRLELEATLATVGVSVALYIALLVALYFAAKAVRMRDQGHG